MACGGCGKSSHSKRFDIYISINGVEYYIGPRPLGSALKSLYGKYEDNTPYEFFQINKSTKSKLSGILTYVDGLPYLNGSRVI